MGLRPVISQEQIASVQLSCLICSGESVLKLDDPGVIGYLMTLCHLTHVLTILSFPGYFALGWKRCLGIVFFFKMSRSIGVVFGLGPSSNVRANHPLCGLTLFFSLISFIRGGPYRSDIAHSPYQRSCWYFTVTWERPTACSDKWRITWLAS